MNDQAERKETKNGCPSRKERNEKWSTQWKGSTSQLKGNKSTMDDTAKRNETKNG